MNLKKQALAGVKWTFLQQVGMQGIRFIISVILARILAPQEFGLIAMIAVFIAIGNTLLNAGLGSSLIRSKDVDEKDYSTVFYFNLIASILIYILIYFLAPYIAKFYRQDILTSLIRWYSLIFIINAFSMIQLTRLTKLMNFKTQTLVSIPSLLIGGFVGVYMAYKGYGVWSLIGYYLTQALANGIMLWIYSQWKPLWVFDKEKFKKHFHFGYKLTISGLLDTVFNNIYNIVIGKFFPLAQVGYYQRAQSLQMYPVGIIGSIMGKVTYPLFAQIQDDNKRLKGIYKKILQLNIFILAPTLIIAGVLAVPLFRFLFTEKWLPAVPYFQILLITGILYPIHSFNLNILNVKGRSDLFLRLEIVKKVLIALVIAFTLHYGIYGLLWGSVFTSIAAFFINTHYSGKFIQYTALEQVKDILPILSIAVVSALPVYFMQQYVQNYISSDFLILVIGGLTGGLIFVFLSYIFKLDSLLELSKIAQRR